MFNKINTTPDKLIFSKKVRDLCKSCKRYNTSASCPPNIESIDYYQKAVLEYKHLDIYYKSYIIKEFNNIVDAGRKSSLNLHKFLLSTRKERMQNGQLFVTCFSGGSCKLCTQCSIPCKYPDKSLSPLEAIGVNVFDTLKQWGIILPTKITTEFFRVGAILYD